MATLNAYYAINMMNTVFVDGVPTNFNSGNQVTLTDDKIPGVTANLFGNFTWDTNTKPYPTLGGNINDMVVNSSSRGDLYKIVFDTANSSATTFQTLVSNDIAMDADKWVFGGNDVITGSAENDFLGGCGGDDTIKGGGGNDTISGGSSGATTAVFDATFAASKIIKNSDGTYSISNAVDGTDTLINVTYAKFSDKTVTLADVAPTIYNWSSLTNNQQLTFDPSKDKLIFDDASILAANLAVSFSDMTSVTIAYGGKAVTIGASIKSLTTSNVTFANGSLLVVGDNAVAATADDNANTLVGSAQGDLLVGLGGGDVINGGTGDDVILIGYPTAAVGNDTVDGGAGTDTLIYSGSNTSTPAITVDMARHTVSSSQGTLTIQSIERVRGTAGNDTFIGGASEHKIDSLGNITNEIFRGNGGNDTISGVAHMDPIFGNDVDYRVGADYSNNTSMQAINADLHTGFVSDGLGGTDKLTFVSMVFGGAGNDVIAGGSLTRGHTGTFWEMFRGNAGDDTLDGANKWSDGGDASSDRADYSNNTSAQAINVNMVTGKVADGLGGTDTLIDIDQVWGGAGNDVFLGGAGNETFDGGAGNDTLDGGGGSNRVSYKQSTNGVIVNLGGAALNVDTRIYPVAGVSGVVAVEAGTANDGMGGTDTLRNIANINGSDFGDYLRGSDIVGQRSFLGGLGGDNVLVGGAGVGIADYSGLPPYFGFDVFVASLVADANGKVSVKNGLGGVDTLINIKGLAGTHGADSLTGGAGDEFFRGNGGADTIDGGAGDDWVLYNNSASGVDVNLATGLAVDGWNGVKGLLALGGTDRLVNIENVEGSNDADKLTGDAGGNLFKGLSGDDIIDGGLGKDTAYYLGAKADYVVTKVGNGVYTVKDKVAGRDGTDTVKGVENLIFSDGAMALSTSVPLSVATARNDFNGDGKSDILLNYEKDGSFFVWEMDGLKLASSDSYGYVGWTAGAAWQAKGTGDFNGDGKSGILLQNSDTGDCYVWELNGRSLVEFGFVGWSPGKEWQAKGTGDFNGDGRSDILLQNSINGDCYVWEMNGLSLASDKSFGYVGWTPGKEWEARGIGDFNGDGKSDILLQNSFNGDCYVWEMNGLSLASDKSFGYVGWSPGKEWQAKGAGDFNGDGKSDILLQNSINGDCYVWEMNGLSLASDKSFGYVGWTPGKDWVVKATGDYNGDGKSDILLQNSADSSCYVWQLDGLNPLSSGNFGYVGWTPGADWQATA